MAASGNTGDQMESKNRSIMKFELPNLASSQNLQSNKLDEQAMFQKFDLKLTKYEANNDRNQSQLIKKPKTRATGYKKWSKMND